jgi:hypothetical protein
VIRLRQLDSLHQYSGDTAASTPSLAKLFDPGRRLPVASQASVLGVSAQLSPMMGITTIEHGVVSEHPSDSFSVADRTSKLTCPVPLAPVNAATSAGGNDAPTAASGGMVLELHAANVLPLTGTKGVACVE